MCDYGGRLWFHMEVGTECGRLGGGGDLLYFIFIDSIAVCVYIRHELTNVGSF